MGCVLGGWLTVAVGATIVAHLISLHRHFDYRHAWISAHFSTAARTFVENGVLALRGIPIVNNPPFGNVPEASLHWPPLFPILLSGLFRAFGTSEAVGHGLMLVITLATCAALTVLLARAINAVAGLAAGFAWLCLPVVGSFGHLVWNLHLAILLTLISLIAY